MKVRLQPERIVLTWRNRILALLQTKFTGGITVEDVMRTYPSAPRPYVELALQGLLDAGIATDISDAGDSKGDV